jgi:hypothetical protein
MAIDPRVMNLPMLIVFGIIWGAGKIPDQARVLMRFMDAQLDVLQQRLPSVGVDLFGPDGDRDFSRWFPDHSIDRRLSSANAC